MTLAEFLGIVVLFLAGWCCHLHGEVNQASEYVSRLVKRIRDLEDKFPDLKEKNSYGAWG